MKKNKPNHIGIYIDDIDRAKNFYNELFGWEFNSYGPSDFLQIKSGEELIGALQSRKYSPIKDKVIGFECTIAVENIEKTEASIVSSGGKVLLSKTEIPQVGWIIKFLDTEGNIVCAMQYH